MTAHLVKMEGAGNDFLLGIGEWARRLADDPDLVARMCRRHFGLGADGALAVELAAPARVRVVYRNADGSRALFCANGTRCAALAATRLLGLPHRLEVETDWAVVAAEVRGGRVELVLPPPESDPDDVELETAHGVFHGRRLVVGVPHLVIRVTDLDGFDLASIGGVLAHHPSLGVDGANVTLVADGDSGRLRVRSFERGVEAETQCCGSGVVAAGLLELAARGTEEVELRPRSGDVLRVRAAAVPPLCASRLDGPARFVAMVEPAAELLEP